MTFSEKYQKAMTYCKNLMSWGILSLAIGVLGGLLGALFSRTLHFVTGVRSANPWLVWLLPLGGLLSVGLYKLLHLSGNRGTNEVIEAAQTGQPVKGQIAPGIFLAATVTHLFGGSAGREGAALQLGGAAASVLADMLKLRPDNRRLFAMMGMCAAFAGLFGTPLTAAVFCVEFVSVGMLLSPALLPCLLSALVASKVSCALGVQAEILPLEQVFSLSLAALWRYLALAVLVSFLGIGMCALFHNAEKLAARYLKNPWLRIAVGGVIIAVLTAIVGDMRFNGAGMEMALAAVAGEGEWYFFLGKLLFTAITLAAGFKGGEIVPTFCIGATFGCVAGALLGIDPGFAAALGLAGLFCCVTNSPIASILLSVEMFGGENILIFALFCLICFAASGKSGLYSSQILPFEKAMELGKRKEHQ